jgi:hypothetical protein
VSRLRAFPDHRFIGTRDDMRVHDCDNALQFTRLSVRVEAEGLLGSKTLASFGPDTLAEARNRGFSPAR